MIAAVENYNENSRGMPLQAMGEPLQQLPPRQGNIAPPVVLSGLLNAQGYRGLQSDDAPLPAIHARVAQPGSANGNLRFTSGQNRVSRDRPAAVPSQMLMASAGAGGLGGMPVLLPRSEGKAKGPRNGELKRISPPFPDSGCDYALAKATPLLGQQLSEFQQASYMNSILAANKTLPLLNDQRGMMPASYFTSQPNHNFFNEKFMQEELALAHAQMLADFEADINNLTILSVPSLDSLSLYSDKQLFHSDSSVYSDTGPSCDSFCLSPPPEGSSRPSPNFGIPYEVLSAGVALPCAYQNPGTRFARPSLSALSCMPAEGMFVNTRSWH